MKKIYQGILFVAFFAVAIYGIGSTDPTSGHIIPAILGFAIIIALMIGAGMIEKPVSKEEYDRIYRK